MDRRAVLLLTCLSLLGCGPVSKMNDSRMAANELAAIRTVSTIHSAQAQYFSQFGKYAPGLKELGPAAAGPVGISAADLIPGDLATGKKNGYTFQLQGTQNGYTVSAAPEAYNGTGRRTFYSDQTMVIRENPGPEPATASSKEVGK